MVELPYKQRKHEFCSIRCATSWRNENNPGKWNSKEARENQAKSMKQFYIDNPEEYNKRCEQLSKVNKHNNHKSAWSKTKKPSQEEMNRIYGRVGEKNNMFGKPPGRGAGRGKQGFREDIGHFVRSCWEANVARVLKFNGYNYSYELEVFKMILEDGTKTSYTPDFLINGNIYIEVKGYMDDIHQKKTDKFRETHILLIIGKKEYEKMLKNYKTRIDFEDYNAPRIFKGELL